MSSKLLSKSKYLNGLQCPKLLWISFNRPDLIPQPDAVTQNRFDQGNLVGNLAKQLFPQGVDIPTDDFMKNIRMTKELLKQRKPLFEAAVMVGQRYSRADILSPVNEEEWDIIEVKSSTEVKDINLHDVSFQELCWEDSGVRIRKCFLAYINNKYIKDGDINPHELFILEDISARVEEVGNDILNRIDEMFEIVIMADCPETPIGSQCDEPYECALNGFCRANLPEHNVFTLYYGGKKACELYNLGITEIAEIPPIFQLNEKQQIQRSCIVNNNTHLDRERIQLFLGQLQYPLYFLDFETFNTVIPLFDGTHPYQNIPFQFSLHIKETPESGLRHISFLAKGKNDPRPDLLDSLSRNIGDSGSIVAYNKQFEEKVLKDLSIAFPEYADRINSMLPRFIDLLVPFRAFAYYNPSQKGSASLKKVLPAVTGMDYMGLEIGKGDDASLAYLDMTYGDLSDEECLTIREQLLAYCGLDTEGMVRIIEKLEEITNK